MIADEKLIMISAFAALDTPGVAALADGTTADMLPGIDRSKISDIVMIEHIPDADGSQSENSEISVSIKLIYGDIDMLSFVTESVQHRIKSSIETLTDVRVSKVHVTVTYTL